MHPLESKPRLRSGLFFGRVVTPWLVAPGKSAMTQPPIHPISAGSSLGLAYVPILIYAVLILGFALGSLFLTHVVGPKKRTPVKLMPYESGMDPVGDARHRFDVKFYLLAIIFLVFDVELLFLYPWAVVFFREPALLPAELHGAVFWEILVFIATLIIAYIYAWRKGVFEWR
jgi:NADH-quinone oxidoreductase subunit A